MTATLTVMTLIVRTRKIVNLLAQRNCTNGVDDDGDNDVDCDDTDCMSDPACQMSSTETDCANGLDDDMDGDVDCADTDCTGEAIPGSQSICEIPETSCNDNQDNDGDGDFDCNDMDCLGTPSCPFSGEICNNGIDDDNNLATDCGDPACFGQTITVTDTNGVQWTGVCNASANLPETDCQDGIDNDGDFNYGGDLDCADTDCANDAGCLNQQPEDCTLGSGDEDGNGLADCADPVCQQLPQCANGGGSEDCALVGDEDGNGLADCEEQACDGQPIVNLQGSYNPQRLRLRVSMVRS